MLTLKQFKCPKCEGKIVIDRDYYGWFLHCIHCGYVNDLNRLNRRIPENIIIDLEAAITNRFHTMESFNYEFETSSV